MTDEKKNSTGMLRHVARLWRNCYVEMHMFVFWLGFSLHLLSSFPSLYNKICYNIFASEEICFNLAENKTAENQVQTEAARWLQYMELAKFFPNILSALVLGKYSDLYGVKVPLLFALGSVVLQMFFLMLSVSSSVGWPLYSLIIGSFFTQFGGTTTVFVASEFSQIARLEHDENKLTFRYSILIGAWNVGFIVSGNILPYILGIISYETIMVIGQSVVTLAFISVLFSFKSEKVVEEAKIVDEKQSEENKLPIGTNKEIRNVISQQKKVQPNFIRGVIEIFADAWLTLTKSRPNNERIYLYIILLVGLIGATTDVGLDSLVTLYVYRAPLSWGPEEYSYWSAAMYVSTTVGVVVAAYVLKRFKFSELTIVVIGLVSAMLKMAVISVATQSWVMYLSLVFGAISSVGMSSLRAFLALLGDKHETGSLMSLQTLVMSWCILFGAIVFNNMYAASLNFFPGLSFAFDSFLLFLCIIAILFVRFDSNRKAKLNEKNLKNETIRL